MYHKYFPEEGKVHEQQEPDKTWLCTVIQSALIGGRQRGRQASSRFAKCTSMSSCLLMMSLALASAVPAFAEVYRFPLSSSSSSLNSADVVANPDQLSHLVTSSVLSPNRPQTALFVNPKLNYEQVRGEQQSNKKSGQKEAEQAMNPNEVFSDQVAILEPIADWQPEMEFDVEDLDKRAKWTSLQGGWGKRAANNWNKLSAAWGKRRAPNGVNGWNNLSGMWGKKRAKWNELSGMWGKRAWNDMAGGWGKKKRSSSPHWNKLRGMWGKRSVIPPLAPSPAASSKQ